jgi:hypothetical protein
MNSTVIPLLSQPKDLTGHFEMDISQDEHVDVHQDEPDYVRVDIELAEPLSLVSACPLPAPRKLARQFLKQARAQGIDPTYHPARFLGAIAVSTNDMVDTHLRIQGNHSQHLAIVPKAERGLDTDCINEVLSTLCFELPPGVVLHDAPSPDLRIIWTDETGATETQRIPGNFVHLAS